jgi:hypothetical protein
LGTQKFGFVLTDDHQHISSLIGAKREMGGECGAEAEILRSRTVITRAAAMFCRGSIQTPTQSTMSLRPKSRGGRRAARNCGEIFIACHRKTIETIYHTTGTGE